MKKQVGELRIMSIQCVQFGKEFPFIVLSFHLFSSVKWCLWILLCMNTCVYWAWVDFFTLTLSALSLNVCIAFDPGHGRWSSLFLPVLSSLHEPYHHLSFKWKGSLANFPWQPPTGLLSTTDTWTFNYSLWQKSKCVCPKHYTYWNKIFWVNIHFCIYRFIITS